MKLIKPIIAALCLALGLNACANNKESKNQNKKGANMEIVHLTKTEFLNKVYNYEANPNDWKYEGDKPCIVDFTLRGVARARLLPRCWKNWLRNMTAKSTSTK